MRFLTFPSLTDRATSIQEPCGAPAVPGEHGHALLPVGGSETKRTGAGRVGDRGEWRSRRTKCC